MQALYFAGDWLRQRARERMVAEGVLAPHRAMGWNGEDMAHRYLQKQGLRVIARNWRTRSGSAEIDLIAWDESAGLDGEVLVFVEVKTRGSEDWNAPERAVDTAKRRNIARAAGEFVRRFGIGQEKIRFDVVSLVLPERGSRSKQLAQVRHWRDAFAVEGLETRKVETGAGSFASAATTGSRR